MEGPWKANWDEARRHFVEWWDHEGLVLNTGSVKRASPPRPGGEGECPEAGRWRYDLVHEPERFALMTRWELARQDFPADSLPLARPTLGPGSLGTMLGAEPVFEPDTVWYKPCIAEPERQSPPVFSRSQRWWKVHEALIRACVRASRGEFIVGCPDLIENLDTLAALRGTQEVLMDLYDRPAWVKERISEINRAFFDAFDAVYDIIRLPDGSSAFWAFDLWGPGKVAKVQCDASAMLSPGQFREFVVPALREQCDWLDHSMFHLDGSQCTVHLDALFEIDSLDAIEWTPDPRVPGGGDPHWYDMYRRILAAGKSVQAVHVRPGEVVPLIEAVGPEGLYILTSGLEGAREAEELVRAVEQFRA